MKRPAECPHCGAKVIGAFCVECGKETGAPAKRVRVLFDCPENIKTRFQMAAARSGMTDRAWLLEAIAGKLSRPAGETTNEQIDYEVGRAIETISGNGPHRSRRRRKPVSENSPGEG